MVEVLYLSDFPLTSAAKLPFEIISSTTKCCARLSFIVNRYVFNMLFGFYYSLVLVGLLGASVLSKR